MVYLSFIELGFQEPTLEIIREIIYRHSSKKNNHINFVLPWKREKVLKGFLKDLELEFAGRVTWETEVTRKESRSEWRKRMGKSPLKGKVKSEEIDAALRQLSEGHGDHGSW